MGVSIYDKNEFFQSVKNSGISYIQIPNNILNREINQESISLGFAQNKKIIIRSIFLQGLLTSNWHDLAYSAPKLEKYIKQVASVAGKYKMSVEECVFLWLSNLYNIAGVIIGVESIEQLRLNYELFNSVEQNTELFEELKSVDLPSLSNVDPRFWVNDKN